MAAKKKAKTVEVVEVVETVSVKETKVNQVLANEDIDKLRDEYKTKSAVIRYLGSKEYTRSDIAKALNIRYQHVRNVLVVAATKEG